MLITEERKAAVAAFNRRIAGQPEATETVDCLCGSNRSKPLANRDRYGLWNPVVICRACGLIYANPRLAADQLEAFYSSDEYRIIYEGSNNFVGVAAQRFAVGHGVQIFERLAPVMADRNLHRVVELGCGGGWNLIHFQRCGFDASGFDYSPGLVKFGRALGLNLARGSIDSLNGQYDVIIMNHVLEHFLEPRKVLKNLLGHLGPRGIVYIGVPDMDNFDPSAWQNAHIYYFTIRTLVHYAAESGLTLLTNGPDQHHIYGLFTATGPNEPIPEGLAREFRRMNHVFFRSRLKERAKQLLEHIHFLEPGRRLYRALRSRRARSI